MNEKQIFQDFFLFLKFMTALRNFFIIFEKLQRHHHKNMFKFADIYGDYVHRNYIIKALKTFSSEGKEGESLIYGPHG